jgi:galactose mutarotase-like enzyme
VHQARAAGAEIDRYGLAGRPVVEGVAGYQGHIAWVATVAMASCLTVSNRHRRGCV